MNRGKGKRDERIFIMNRGKGKRDERIFIMNRGRRPKVHCNKKTMNFPPTCASKLGYHFRNQFQVVFNKSHKKGPSG